MVARAARMTTSQNASDQSGPRPEPAVTAALERSSRFLAGLCRLDCRISADCEPAQPASEAVERTPTLAAVFRDAQRKAWECGIEILDAPARWRLSPFNKQVCELSRWHPRLCYAG